MTFECCLVSFQFISCPLVFSTHVCIICIDVMWPVARTMCRVYFPELQITFVLACFLICHMCVFRKTSFLIFMCKVKYRLLLRRLTTHFAGVREVCTTRARTPACYGTHQVGKRLVSTEKWVEVS